MEQIRRRIRDLDLIMERIQLANHNRQEEIELAWKRSARSDSLVKRRMYRHDFGNVKLRDRHGLGCSQRSDDFVDGGRICPAGRLVLSVIKIA